MCDVMCVQHGWNSSHVGPSQGKGRVWDPFYIAVYPYTVNCILYNTVYGMDWHLSLVSSSGQKLEQDGDKKITTLSEYIKQ